MSVAHQGAERRRVPAALRFGLIGFIAAAAAPLAQGDLIPPAIVSRSPAPGASGVATSVEVQATFGEPVVPGTLLMEVRNASNQIVPAVLTYDGPTSTATLDPVAELAASQTFSVSVSGGRDAAGNLMTPVSWTFTTGTTGFQDVVLPQTGLVDPTVMRFAPDNRLFVAEKSGRVYVFDNLADPSPTLVIDLRTSVHNFWDRGLLGMALHPNFPAVPYLYVLYAYDAAPGGAAPRWGAAGAVSDGCPDPPGATNNGCVITGRLARFNITDSSLWPLTESRQEILLTDWFQQFPSHSTGALAFGADGALYASAGDGASFNYADYGQTASNPSANDPSQQGGALRSQDIRTAGDPVTLDGTIIRLDPDTGAALPDNPRIADPDANGKRLVAHGLRNPFRFTVRPGTNELWVGDVGWNTWEEINRVVDGSDSTVENFGWPCYEGGETQPGYNGLNLPICETLYGQSGSEAPPYFFYRHSDRVVTGEACPTGSSSVSGLAFYPQSGAAYPAAYRGALFFSDYSRRCIWAMRPGPNGLPDPNDIVTIRSAAPGPVDLVSGPAGDIFYAGLTDDRLHRLQYSGGNVPPSAVLTADTTSGALPLQVAFSAAASSDPEGQSLSYAWDLDGDGEFDDGAAATAAFTYTVAGSRVARVRVSDAGGLSDVAALTIWPGNRAPIATISAPSAAFTWKVGDSIGFSGAAEDPDEGALPASAMQWTVVMHHCPSNCHGHDLQSFAGVSSGAFSGPDHEYPSHLELRLTVTDGGGLQSSTSVLLQPQTVALTFATSPAGLQLSVNGASALTPFTRTVIVGSSNSLGAPAPQAVGGDNYVFSSWSDGGAQVHNAIAPASAATYTATFTRSVGAPGLVAAWAFDEGAGTSTADATGGGHTGTLSNAVWSASGKFGSAISFNGTSSLVRVADAPALDFTTGMTIEAWVLPSVLSGWRTVLLKERGNDLTYGLYAWDNAPRPASYVSTGGIGLEATGTAGIPLNTWTHLAATYDGATLRLFVNGTQAGTRALAGAIAVTNGELTIGGNDPWGEFFAGSIDEVRLYNRPLTAAEIQSDMAVPLGGPPPPDTTQPVVSITAPANNSFARGTVTITATATDNSGTVASVQFLVNGAPVGPAATSVPFSASWSTVGLTGPVVLTAVATDGSGNSRTSAAVNVVVDNTGPAVALTAPAAGPVSGTVAVSATATDTAGVASVQFQVDGSNIGTADTSAPYSVSWNTGSVANGAHVLTAVAVDAAGNMTVSSPVNVTVSNTWTVPSGLVAAYTFSEGAGTTTADASGNGRTGTLAGGVSWVGTGRFGGALTFNGLNGLVSVADANALDFTTSLTIEAWVRPAALSGWNTLVLKNAGSSALAYGLYVNDNAPRPAGYVEIGGVDRSVPGTAAIPLNTWTHIAMTYGGGMMRLYVNGVQVGTRSVTGTIRVSANPLTIGGNTAWGEWFSGTIDELRLYNRELSPAEIQAGMTQTIGN